jgi:hypothetical protein
MNNFLKQVWIAFKIWLVAVSIDTLLGTLFLSVTSWDYSVYSALNDLGLYASISSLFSFPVFLMLVLIINRCLVSGATGLRTYSIILLSGIGLTILVYVIFISWIGGMNKVIAGHFLIAILSGIAGIFFQRASILRIADAS